MLGSQACRTPGWGLVTRFLVPRWQAPSAPEAVFSFHFSLPPQFTSVFSSASNVALTLCPTAPQGLQTRVTVGQVPLIGSEPTMPLVLNPSGLGAFWGEMGETWAARGAGTGHRPLSSRRKLWEAGPWKGARPRRGAGPWRRSPARRGAEPRRGLASLGASFCGVSEDAHSVLTASFSYRRGRVASHDPVSPLTSHQGTRGSERASPVPGRCAQCLSAGGSTSPGGSRGAGLIVCSQQETAVLSSTATRGGASLAT